MQKKNIKAGVTRAKSKEKSLTKMIKQNGKPKGPKGAIKKSEKNNGPRRNGG